MGHAGRGWNTHCEVRFTGVRVPGARTRSAGEGEAFRLAQKRLGPGRIHHVMRWLGQMQRAFELMCRYANEREAFGGPLAEKQTVQNWIADSAAEIQACRLLTMDAARKIDEGSEARVEVSLLKFYAARVLVRGDRPRDPGPRRPRAHRRDAARTDGAPRPRGADLRRPGRGAPHGRRAADPEVVPRRRRLGSSREACRRREGAAAADGLVVRRARARDAPGSGSRPAAGRAGRPMRARSRPTRARPRPPRATSVGRRSGKPAAARPLARVPGEHRRVDDPRADRVDRDPALGERRRDASDEADDGVLRRRVHGVVGDGREPRERRGADDPTAGWHDRREPPDAEHDAVDVHRERAPVAVERRSRPGRRGRRARRRSGTRRRKARPSPSGRDRRHRTRSPDRATRRRALPAAAAPRALPRSPRHRR